MDREVVGKIHNNRLTAKELAEELGWNDKYLSQVLNSENPPKNAEQKVNDALGRIIERKSKSIPETKEGEGVID
ncbi:MAG: hypothetical protein ACLS4A_12665 [Oscillospiraceae bacterium]